MQDLPGTAIHARDALLNEEHPQYMSEKISAGGELRP